MDNLPSMISPYGMKGPEPMFVSPFFESPMYVSPYYMPFCPIPHKPHFTNVAIILVLFILLVIVARGRLI